MGAGGREVSPKALVDTWPPAPAGWYIRPVGLAGPTFPPIHLFEEAMPCSDPSEA